MEVKKGYKQTEVGVIPKDWDVRHLRPMLKQNPAYGINAAAVPLKGDLPVYIRITDISDEGYFMPSHRVGVDHPLSEKYYLEKGDLVFARTGASVGKSYLYNPDDGKLVYAGFLIKIKPDERVLSPAYLSQYVKTQTYWGWVQIMSMRSGQPGINGNEYGQLLLPLPPTKGEQTAIVAVLSDADALIQSLEKLIAKKRNIKQGAMQELLKPKEDWMVKRLGTFLDYVQPTRYLVIDTEYNDNNDTPVLTAGKTFILGYTNEEFGIYKDNFPVIIFDDFTTATKYVDFSFKAKSSAMKILRKKYETVNLKFIFEIMQQINYPLGDHKRHWIAEYQNIEIRIPKPEEQTRIANILSDMDAEIAGLETKLAKYKQIKQGMMQELLTGRIRLV